MGMLWYKRKGMILVLFFKPTFVPRKIAWTLNLSLMPRIHVIEEWPVFTIPVLTR